MATGAGDDRVVEIVQGVAPGDVVVVRGAFSLSQLRGVASAPAETPAETPGEAPGKSEPAPGTESQGNG